MKKINYSFLLYFFSGLILSLPFYIYGIQNPDLFWHLSTGKFIFNNLTLPHYDFLSWTLKGKPWINFEWFTQIIYFQIYKLFSFEGLYYLKLIIISLAFFIFSLILKEKKVSSFNLIWLIPFTSAAINNSLDVRPENFSFLLFILTLLSLEKIKSENYSYSNLYFKILPFIFIIWTNLHGGFVFGLTLIFIYFLGELLNENLNYINGKEKFKFKNSKNLLILFFLSSLSTLLNPYGIKIYQVILEHYKYSSINQSYNYEWQDFDITFENLRVFSFILIFSPVFYLINFLKKRKINFTEIFLMIFFVLISLLHIRNIIFSSIILIFLMIDPLLSKINSLRYKISISFLSLFFLYLFFFNVLFKNLNNFKINSNYFTSPSMIKFLKENEKILSPLKMYNSLGWGGYLGFNLYPEYKVFIDGRYIFNPMLENYIESRKSLSFWNTFEKEYNIDLVILPPSTITENIKVKDSKGKYRFVPFSLDYLKFENKNWAIIYFDKKNFIAVKRNKVPQKWLKENEYIYLKP